MAQSAFKAIAEALEVNAALASLTLDSNIIGDCMVHSRLEKRCTDIADAEQQCHRVQWGGWDVAGKHRRDLEGVARRVRKVHRDERRALRVPEDAVERTLAHDNAVEDVEALRGPGHGSLDTDSDIHQCKCQKHWRNAACQNNMVTLLYVAVFLATLPRHVQLWVSVAK